jgi:hypothetical protein
MNGIEHISEAFAAAKSESRAALMPYFTLGYPTADISLAILEAIAGAGANLIELGIPFSDPLADGPTIQHSTQVALENGMNTGRCLEAGCRPACFVDGILQSYTCLWGFSVRSGCGHGRRGWFYHS